MEINEKIYKRIFIIGILIIVYYCAMTFFSFAIPRVYHIEESTILDTENVVKYDIHHLYRGSFFLQISGWAYKEGQAVGTFKNSFVLKNRETGKMYLLKTGVKEIPELQFVDGQNCLKCGMESQSMVLGLKDGMYDLYILYQNDQENLLVNANVEVEI